MSNVEREKYRAAAISELRSSTDKLIDLCHRARTVGIGDQLSFAEELDEALHMVREAKRQIELLYGSK